MNDSELALKVLHFSVQDVRMCIDLNCVTRVLQLTHLETLPASPDYVAGILNLANVNIPVVDLALRLNIPRETAYTLETPIIICEIKEKNIGMIVDSILGLETIGKGTLQLDKDLNSSHSPFIGSANINSEVSLILNLLYVTNISLSKNTIDEEVVNAN